MERNMSEGEAVKIIAPEDKKLKGEIKLPFSKSVSNRVLIIKLLSDSNCEIKNISESQDTKSLISVLEKINHDEINAGSGGTTFRFIMALLSLLPGKRKLTCSEQMKNRPIEALVSALQDLGADISYAEETGKPPLIITGRNLIGGSVELDASISSQYLSALAMIAPYCKNGIEVTLKGDMVSRPYLEMTLRIMSKFGAEYSWEGNVLSVKPGAYEMPESYEIEPDWSAASYWYELAAFSNEAQIKLRGLNKSNLQADCAVSRIYKGFGVDSYFSDDGVELVKLDDSKRISHKRLELLHNPDLAQTVAVTIAGLGSSGTLLGLKTLKVKETDRIEALRIELTRLGAEVDVIDDTEIIVDRADDLPVSAHINTYGDHRMAMSFAPLALVMESVTIDNPKVVAKSYPNFWSDLEQMGFKIETVTEEVKSS
jgi:3-phosphoshikimate 1-carboxyvinyltransferase